jgi:hypothetical protein
MGSGYLGVCVGLATLVLLPFFITAPGGFIHNIVQGLSYHHTASGLDVWTAARSLGWTLSVQNPETLSTAISVTSAQEISVAGRPAIELRIEPTEPLLWAAPGPIALGAGSYTLLVDREVGILLATHVYVGGQIARSHALSALTFNGPMPDELYVPDGWTASAPVLPPWTA